MSIFAKVGAWISGAIVSIGDAFKFVETSADKIAMALTEGIKTALINGTLGFIADVLDGLTKSQIPTEVVTVISNNIDKVLAVELAIEGLPPNPTPEDILTFEQSVLKAFSVTSSKSKIYTSLAAQVYGIIQTEVNKHEPIKFADLVSDVEEAYADYQQDLAAQTTD